MPGVDNADLAGAVAEAHRPSIQAQTHEKWGPGAAGYAESIGSSTNSEPTLEEMKTLRRVSGKIGWRAFSITLVEFCERFSWYGTTAIFVNFIQQPRPYGSPTGAINESQECYDAVGRAICLQPGGLGQGQRASTGLTTFNQFWAYVMPLLGGKATLLAPTWAPCGVSEPYSLLVVQCETFADGIMSSTFRLFGRHLSWEI